MFQLERQRLHDRPDLHSCFHAAAAHFQSRALPVRFEIDASDQPIEFTLPSEDYAPSWTPVLDTAEMNEVDPVQVKPGETVTVQGRSIVVLRGPAL